MRTSLVRKNGGVAGIDNETLEKFGQNEKNNLYKLWARMSSGSYFPKAGYCIIDCVNCS